MRRSTTAGRLRRVVVVVAVGVVGWVVLSVTGRPTVVSVDDAQTFLDEVHRRAVRAVDAPVAEVDWCELGDDPVTCADGLANLPDDEVSAGLPAAAPRVVCTTLGPRNATYAFLDLGGGEETVRLVATSATSTYGMTIDEVRYWTTSGVRGLTEVTCP